MDQVLNPYFSVEISEEQINRIRSIIKKNLDSFNFNFVDLDNPHISVSYFLGSVKMENIESVANELIEAPFKMKVLGIATIESSYYGGTIVSLKLQQTDDFLYCQEYLKECLTDDSVVKIKEFKGGFIAHVSLFVIKNLAEKDKFPLSRVLEMSLSDLGGKYVQGEKLCMYNPEREKIMEKFFKPSE